LRTAAFKECIADKGIKKSPAIKAVVRESFRSTDPASGQESVDDPTEQVVPSPAVTVATALQPAGDVPPAVHVTAATVHVHVHVDRYRLAARARARARVHDHD